MINKPIDEMTENQREVFEANRSIVAFENWTLAISIVSGLLTTFTLTVAIFLLANGKGFIPTFVVLNFYLINVLGSDYARATIGENIQELRLHKMEIISKMTKEELTAFRLVKKNDSNENNDK